MSRRRSRSPSPLRTTTNSDDPRDLARRIFVGNLPTTLMDTKDLEELFRQYGKINDINMAAERRHNKAQSRPSPPRRHPYGGYGEGRDGRPRSRSPMHNRESRDHRDGRDMRDPSRETSRERPGPPREHGPPRDHDSRDPAYERYRGSESREKDPAFREEGYDRYYRGMDEYYRKKEAYREPYRGGEPWNGARREPPPEEDRLREGERRRNELYRQYYEELQRRYDTERPVDCSVIVVNKLQKEYAETVGRKVRDVGMVVDLIFLNTEVSLSQALEDVGRAHTPFAIIITQQHQVHRSCTVNILFGTPQEHRNMPMEDAMVLVEQNFVAYKAEHRDKEREEIARKAAKMADDVLMRELDTEAHPVSLLSTITLLSENRFLTPEELDRLQEYLRDKRERLVRGGADGRSAKPLPSAAASLHMPSTTAYRHAAPEAAYEGSHAVHAAPEMSHEPMAPPPVSHQSAGPPPTAASSNHQQELQAKILSLFNSGSSASSAVPPVSQGYGSAMGSQQAGLPPPKMSPQPRGPPQGVPPPGYGPPPPAGRMGAPPPSAPPARPPLSTGTGGINFDNPSVQKALDTLIQSGPSINHLVNSGSAPPPAGPRPGMGPGPGMGQGMPMSHYGRHY
ncbi:nuclear receptor coactivator 5 isoform X2 [Engraulis encrasicolus]|uniref:nuclear receptor coactivator 5 isoform X2 n=1 Tax=Engraulis encrasicolus TaxID=184585 RepID=UPI002FCEB6C1